MSPAGPLSAAAIATFLPALSGGPFPSTPPDTPHVNWRQTSTRAPHAARSSPEAPFWKARRTPLPARRTCQRLRQVGNARQDLVRISERTTKCGDYGDESGGDAEVSRIRGESERELRPPSRFHSPAAPNRTALALGRRDERAGRPLARLKHRARHRSRFVA